MSGSVYPPEKLTERYTPPIVCRRVLLALAVISGGDAPGFGWFTYLSVRLGCRKRLVSRKDVFVTIHRQKLENAAPILNHYFSKSMI